ncbi:MAG: histidine phosphatase family protein [Lysinibacillus sp.]
MANGVTIHLIRHEKTQANVERRYIGWTNQPILNVAPRLMTHETDIVYGSQLRRCEQTAKLYFPTARYIAHQDFNELNFGDFEMRTYDELKHNEQYRKWIDDPISITPPNGEDFLAFKARVLQTFLKVVTTPGTYTFVVHGGVIRVLLEHFLPTKQAFRDIHAAHHTEYILKWEMLDQLKEGASCTSYSEAFLTEKQTM